MPFDRYLLPDATAYFEDQGLKLTGPRKSKWKTTECKFHGGSDSLRVNTVTGSWVCMSCGVKGGDVLAYEIASTGREFVEAAKAIGAWFDDGKPYTPPKPTPLSPRAALSALAFEAMFVAICAANIAKGVVLTDNDRSRLMTAAGRINLITEAFA